MAGELDPMQPNNIVEVLIAVSRVEGQMTNLVQMVAAQSEGLNRTNADVAQLRDHLNTDMGALRDRVTSIEATRKASPPWWVVVGALTPMVALLLLIAQDIYSK